jgi:hypothetical protein
VFQELSISAASAGCQRPAADVRDMSALSLTVVTITADEQHLKGEIDG